MCLPWQLFLVYNGNCVNDFFLSLPLYMTLILFLLKIYGSKANLEKAILGLNIWSVIKPSIQFTKTIFPLYA